MCQGWAIEPSGRSPRKGLKSLNYLRAPRDGPEVNPGPKFRKTSKRHFWNNVVPDFMVTDQ